jgi:hypothetical protein
MPRAALYAPTSTLDRHPEAQLARLREYAFHRGLGAKQTARQRLGSSSGISLPTDRDTATAS